MDPAKLPRRVLTLPFTPGTPTTCLFRRVVRSEHAAELKLSIYAEGNYHAWVNGRYAGRGPAYHHPGQYPIDRHRVAIDAGENVIAILVHLPGVALHNSVPTTTPHLFVRLGNCDALVETDELWRTTNLTGWSDDVPRRSWAIGHIEQFDARVAPRGWQEIGYDDGAWNIAPAAPRDQIAGEWIDRPVPNLRYRYIAPERVTGVFGVATPPKPIHRTDATPDAGRALLDMPWLAPGAVQVDGLAISQGKLVVRRLSPQHGAIVCLDLGAQYTGQLTFDCDADSEGMIDVAWSESVDGDKPRIVRKGVSYCDRIHARAGKFRWDPIGYSGMRHLMLVLRGFTGEVRFSNLHLRAGEPDLDWRGEFHSDDARLNRTFDLCARTQSVGTQEGVIDCPTREQAPYVGDGLLIARWITTLTGDARHWRYVVESQFQRPTADGLVRGSIFSGSNTVLIDYSLLAILGLRDYTRCSGDTALARRHIKACRRILDVFEKAREEGGLCATERFRIPQGHQWTSAVDVAHPGAPPAASTLLFIDHPGMGWHNVGEAGIDRRGINCAFNALLAQAYLALAELETATGSPTYAAAALKQAATLRKLVGERFLGSDHVFSDGIFEGKLLDQRSEQTNTWAIACGACDNDTARAALTSMLTDPNPAVARAGPYFWSYVFPQLARLGLHELGLDQLRDRWSRMLAGDATLLWETFVGDDLDSLCHPWSGAPLEFLLNHIAGLPGMLEDDVPTLRPRFDLLRECHATAFTRHGQWSIEWKRGVDKIDLSVTAPADTSAMLVHPCGRVIDTRIVGGKTVTLSLDL